MPWWGVVLLLVGLVQPQPQPQPREPLPLVVQLQLSDSGQPVADVTCTLVDAEGQVVAVVTTDAGGRARVTLPPDGYTLTLVGTTADGVPLQLNGLYAARGLPVFVTAAQPDLLLLVHAPTGLVGFGPILDRDTGSQEAVPPATVLAPVAPVPPSVVAAPAASAVPRPTSGCPPGATLVLVGRTVTCGVPLAPPAALGGGAPPYPLLLGGTALAGGGVLVVRAVRRSRRQQR